MKTQHRRTQTQTAARRYPTPPTSAAIRRSRNARRKSGHKSERRGQGARVIWLLMMIGGLIASGFVLAQRSQINAHQFRQTEEKFRTQLDELSNQQRFLAFEKERATNTQESERVAKQNGLIQPQLKKTGQTAIAQAQPAKPAALAKQATKLPVEPVSNKATKSSIKPAAQAAKSSVKPMPSAKPAASRVPATSGATAKPNKTPNKLMPPSKVAPPGKANKDGKDQRQLAQNPAAGKKEKRH